MSEGLGFSWKSNLTLNSSLCLCVVEGREDRKSSKRFQRCEGSGLVPNSSSESPSAVTAESQFWASDSENSSQHSLLPSGSGPREVHWDLHSEDITKKNIRKGFASEIRKPAATHRKHEVGTSISPNQHYRWMTACLVPEDDTHKMLHEYKERQQLYYSSW